jgi:hypothetical protein
MRKFCLALTFASLQQLACMQGMLDLVFCNPLATILRTTLLLVAIFVSTRNLQDAGGPIKIIQLRAKKCLDVRKGMILTIPAVNFYPFPWLIDLFLLLCWLFALTLQSSLHQHHLLQLREDLL